MEESSPITAKSQKQKFLEDNPDIADLSLSADYAAVSEFYDIGDDDEVWFLQCPKGADITVLQNQKLKLPGRSHPADDLEAVALEFTESTQQAFGYKNEKGHPAIKMLPIQGVITLRNRLKANNPLSLEQIQAHSSNLGRIPLPKNIKERHPIHGVNFQQKIKIIPEIAKRLKRADEISAKVLQESLKACVATRNNTNSRKEVVELESDDDVHFVSEIAAKKKKRKYEHTISNVFTEKNSSAKRLKIPDISNIGDEIAPDLQWINKI